MRKTFPCHDFLIRQLDVKCISPEFLLETLEATSWNLWAAVDFRIFGNNTVHPICDMWSRCTCFRLAPHAWVLGRLIVPPSHIFFQANKKNQISSLLTRCEGNAPLTDEFPSQKASNAENASMPWHHHVYFRLYKTIIDVRGRHIPASIWSIHFRHQLASIGNAWAADKAQWCYSRTIMGRNKLNSDTQNCAKTHNMLNYLDEMTKCIGILALLSFDTGRNFFSWIINLFILHSKFHESWGQSDVVGSWEACHWT